MSNRSIQMRLLTAFPSLVLACLMTFAQLGCGDGRPTRVPVSGVVTVDGQPLTFGRIKFVPDTGRASEGKLDENGRFSLTCFASNDGAILGTHHVEVDAGEALNESQIRWHAPGKYAQYHTSGITQEIDGPVTDLAIELTWAGGKPFVQGSAAAGMPDRPPVTLKSP